MIKLFITDIDGCLLQPMKTPNWDLLAEIKSLNEQSEGDSLIPPLTICTGRPMPYAEATAQWMGIHGPIVFESAGVFYLDGYRVSVNGTFDKKAEKQILKLKEWLKLEVMSQFEGMTPEFSKLMDAGLIHPDESVIQEALPLVQDYVEDNYENFEVHWTDVSINILQKGNNKRAGIQKLCELQKVQPSEVAYIGDSSGDIPGLELVGYGFAPHNATDAVKKVATVIPHTATEAVLKAYQQIVAMNRKTAG